MADTKYFNFELDTEIAFHKTTNIVIFFVYKKYLYILQIQNIIGNFTKNILHITFSLSVNLN